MIGWLILYSRQQRLAEEIDKVKRQQGLIPPASPLSHSDEVKRTFAWLIILAFVLTLAYFGTRV